MTKRNPNDERRLEFRQLLIKHRKAHNIKQIDLAQKLGKPQSFVSKYESGERTLDLIEIYEICSKINIAPIDIFKEFELKVFNGKLMLGNNKKST